MHSQLFHPANNEDGYVSVICHRERYLKELLAMGWFETADEAKANRLEFYQNGSEAGMRPVGQQAAHEIKVVVPVLEDYADPNGVIAPDGFDIQAEPEPEDLPMSMAGLSKSQRKKLRLNK